jgi:hypothetical protein
VAQHPEVHFCPLDSCARSLLLLYPQTLQLPQQPKALPPTRSSLPPWPLALISPSGPRSPIPLVSMADTACAGRRLSLGVRAGHAKPTSRLVPYIAAPAELPCALAAAFHLCFASPLPLFTTASHRRRPLLKSAQGSIKGRCRGHHEHHNTELLILCSFLSPEVHRGGVCTWRTGPHNRRHPLRFWPPLHALAVGEHPHELPSISSTSRAARPNPRWLGPSAIGAGRAALRPDLMEEEGHHLFRPLRFPLIPRSKSRV